MSVSQPEAIFACRPNLLVSDLTTSLRCYSDVLGFRITQIAGGHTTWLHLDVHTSTQVDQLFQEWSARGAVIAEPPALRPWGMYEMRLDDPNGHVLRISSPPAGASGRTAER